MIDTRDSEPHSSRNSAVLELRALRLMACTSATSYIVNAHASSRRLYWN